MKLKEVDRTANVAWSPASHHPIYLAAGTAAQQLDATFSTKASLELYSLNLAESGQDMELAGSLEIDSRLYKLVWGSFGMDSGSHPSGLLIGGAEQGQLSIWDPVKIFAGQDDVIVHQLTKHTGQVVGLDVNPFQMNLLASGSSESEIYIWDLNSPEKPMTPGSKSQQQHAVSGVAWNRQVQHILGSSHGNNCVVWDLRKNEPIIKIRDNMSRIDCDMVCWHPDVATQLCIGSENDQTPVIQLWDLRCATSPLRVLSYHQRGIVSMAWCPHDSDLLLSSGKDNRILCWNPNTEAQTGEVLCEIPTSNHWSFDVQWCRRNPGIISGCSFDGHISIYSLMGGSPPTQPPSKVTEAFPSDPFSQPLLQHAPQEPADTVLKKAPKWLRRPVSASFAFGGKLVCVENPKHSGHGQGGALVVTISQVITETGLVEQSMALEQTIASGQYLAFCDAKLAACRDRTDTDLWSFLRAGFTSDRKQGYLELLQHGQTNIQDKVTQCIAASGRQPESNGSRKEDEEEAEEKLDQAINQFVGLDAFGKSDEEVEEEEASPFDAIAKATKKSSVAAGAEINSLSASSVSPIPIKTGSDCDGLVTEALLTANFAAAVEISLHHNRLAEAIILALAGGPELLTSTQSHILKTSKSTVSRLILSIVTRDFENIVCSCDLSKWKEALVILLTYVDGPEFTYLCNLLGARLEDRGTSESLASAQLCYVVAGNVDQLVSTWSRKLATSSSPDALQDVVEKVTVLRVTVGQQEVTGADFAHTLTEYAHLLASQGCSVSALHYLGQSNEPRIAVLRDRLYHSIGQPLPNIKAPPRPFKVIDVQPQRPRQPSQQQPQAQPVQPRSRTSSANYTYQPAVPQAKPIPVSSFNSNYVDGNPYQVSQGTPYAAPLSSANYFQPANQPLPGVPGYAAHQTPLAPSAAAKGPLSKYSVQSQKPAVQVPAPQLVAPSMFDPYQQQPQLQPQQPQPVYQQGYISQQSQQLPASQGSQTPGAPLPSYVPPSGSTSAWNDPPPVSSVPKKTATDHPGAPTYDGMLYNPLEYEEQLKQHQQQQLQLANDQLQLHQHHHPHHHHQSNIATAADDVSKPVPSFRDTIPVEHVVILDIFDRLVELCQSKAFNAPTRKKLEDVRRKLEALYERLSAGTVSQTTLTGLHQTVQAIQQYDYNTALSIVGQIVNVGSFSEIGVFMPGIKVLLQTAVQLQVYVQ